MSKSSFLSVSILLTTKMHGLPLFFITSANKLTGLTSIRPPFFAIVNGDRKYPAITDLYIFNL